MIASKSDESSSKKTEKARDAVADLERRLAMIGGGGAASEKPTAAATEAPPAFATPPAATAAADATGSKTGKNALLVSHAQTFRKRVTAARHSFAGILNLSGRECPSVMD